MKQTKFLILILLIIIGCDIASANKTDVYSYTECLGSAMPYPTDIPRISYPDSLVPVMINHVGRHGARYASSAKPFKAIKDALIDAQRQQTITPLGEKLLSLVNKVIDINDTHWGQLNSLGEAEQRGIANRMYHNFIAVFDTCHVHAISSYVPRAMMSMYEFNHELDLLDNNIEFNTTTGHVTSPLMRPFDLSFIYKDFQHSKGLDIIYDGYFEQNCPTSAIERVIGRGYQYKDMREARKLAYDEYKVLNGLRSMSIPCDLAEYFTLGEINALWRCFNLRQYLDHSASALSTVPADIASDLLSDIIDTTDAYIHGDIDYNVWLRFGHAETLMPLLSLMRIPGCYYVSADYSKIAQYWRDFDIVPMAANLQMILFKSKESGEFYTMTILNETPVKLIPDNPSTIVPWTTAKAYLTLLLDKRLFCYLLYELGGIASPNLI